VSGSTLAGPGASRSLLPQKNTRHAGAYVKTGGRAPPLAEAPHSE